MTSSLALPPVCGKLTANAPLAPLVWFKSGGSAEWLFEPKDVDDLKGFLRGLDPSVPMMAIGLGSNMIVRDGGVPGVVVRLGKAFAWVDTVAKGTFGLTPSEHAALKGLEKENLRDNMTPLELILTAFGEEVTRQFTIKDDAQGFNENHEAAQRGGSEAGKARENLEKQGLKVVSEENFKHLKQENLKNLKEGENTE